MGYSPWGRRESDMTAQEHKMKKRNERAVDSFPGTSPAPYGNCPGIASRPMLPVLQLAVTLKIFI